MTDIVERIINRIHDSNMDIEILLDDCKIEIESLRQRIAELEVVIKDFAQIERGMEEELAALKQSQGEPVAYIHKWKLHAATMGRSLSFQNRSPHGDDMEIIPLYTSAPTIPEGWQLVPIKEIYTKLRDHYAQGSYTEHEQAMLFAALEDFIKAARLAAAPAGPCPADYKPEDVK